MAIKKTIIKTVSVLSFLQLCLGMPVFVYAQTANFQYVTNVSNLTIGLMVTILKILVAAGIAVFIWGLVLFIKNADNEQARIEGRQKMMWGVIGLFVIVSVWGLVQIVQQVTGVNGNANGLKPPEVSRP